jgi:hypothetical protein
MERFLKCSSEPSFFYLKKKFFADSGKMFGTCQVCTEEKCLETREDTSGNAVKLLYTSMRLVFKLCFSSKLTT